MTTQPLNIPAEVTEELRAAIDAHEALKKRHEEASRKGLAEIAATHERVERAREAFGKALVAEGMPEFHAKIIAGVVR